MNTIAIIPARSGSKGLKDKNIKLLNGKPLIAYTIEAALQSQIFDVVMVSTDSEKYAEIAIQYGAEVPFLRSEQTSSDKATTKECILEVLQNYKQMGKNFDVLAVLQPTSPLRSVQDIINAKKLYCEKQADSVIGVCEMEHSPLWSNTIDESLSLDNFVDWGNSKRRQDLDKYYRINGAIYFYDVNEYVLKDNYFDDKCFAYIMEKSHSVDIDDEFDFMMAETLLKNLQK